jgi:hypothetical protein
VTSDSAQLGAAINGLTVLPPTTSKTRIGDHANPCASKPQANRTTVHASHMSNIGLLYSEFPVDTSRCSHLRLHNFLATQRKNATFNATRREESVVHQT